MKRKKSSVYAVSPQLFSLNVFLIALMSFACYAGCFIFTDYSSHGDYLLICFLWFSLYAIMWAVIIANGFWFLGCFQITRTNIVFYAPFRKRILLNYSEIVEIGIDYGIVNGAKEFWIYFCKNKFPRQFVHNINKMPIGRDWMRVQYTPLIYNELAQVLPQDMAVQLEKGNAIFRNS